MSEEVQVPPPNIWRYEEASNVVTDGVNLKEYKPQGAFYSDAALLCKLYGLKLHPVFREPAVPTDPNDPEAVGGFDDQKRPKEPTTLSISKYRMDMNSLKVMFKVLETCPHIQTLKLQNNGLTISIFNKLVTALSADNCPIINLFVDWNPIYTDEFKAGDLNAAVGSNELYVASDEDVNPWAKLIESNKKLQVLFLRCNALKDADMNAMCNVLKTNGTLKVIDFSSNYDLTNTAICDIVDVLQSNRVIEYLGLSKLNIETEAIIPMMEMFGRFPFPEDQVENQLAELKKKEGIVEKNKKLKSQKKPEEPVPQVDNIEQITRKNDEGEDVQEWVTTKNLQFKHLNLCINNLDDDLEDTLMSLLQRTSDDFGLTVSSNKLSDEVIQKLHNKITLLHKNNIDLAIEQANASGGSVEEMVIDPLIHLKRLSV